MHRPSDPNLFVQELQEALLCCGWCLSDLLRYQGIVGCGEVLAEAFSSCQQKTFFLEHVQIMFFWGGSFAHGGNFHLSPCKISKHSLKTMSGTLRYVIYSVSIMCSFWTLASRIYGPQMSPGIGLPSISTNPVSQGCARSNHSEPFGWYGASDSFRTEESLMNARRSSIYMSKLHRIRLSNWFSRLSFDLNSGCQGLRVLVKACQCFLQLGMVSSNILSVCGQMFGLVLRLLRWHAERNSPMFVYISDCTGVEANWKDCRASKEICFSGQAPLLAWFKRLPKCG